MHIVAEVNVQSHVLLTY